MTNKDYNKVQVKNNMDVKNQSQDKVDDDKADRPKLTSVVSSAPKKIKKSLFSRLITGLVGPEGLSGIGGYVSEEILKPAFKNILVDVVTSGINMMVYGDRGVPNRGGNRPYNSTYAQPRTNYQSQYSTRPAERSHSQGTTRDSDSRNALVVPRGATRYGVEEYIIEDRYDAAHVLTTLTECSDRYNVVSVADYYDLIKVESTYTDNNYGWRHDTLRSAMIVPVRGGYIIKFPPVEAL